MDSMDLSLLISRAPDLQVFGTGVAPAAHTALVHINFVIPGRWIVRCTMDAGEANNVEYFSQSDVYGNTAYAPKALPASFFIFDHFSAATIAAGLVQIALRNIAAGGAGIAYSATLEAWFIGSGG